MNSPDSTNPASPKFNKQLFENSGLASLFDEQVQAGIRKLMKIKLVNVTYDGTNYVPAQAIDSSDKDRIATKDPNVDLKFNTAYPKYDECADGFGLYPMFTAAQVAAGPRS